MPKPSRIFTAKAGWKMVGEQRCYFRSRWELIFARYLQWQLENKLILEWKFEPKTFWFEEIKRGVRSYKPDFYVLQAHGEHFWVEVKGYMDSKSKTKLARLKRFYPEEKIVVIDKRWFEVRGVK